MNTTETLRSKLVLLSTADRLRSADLQRMIGSVEAFVRATPEVRVQLFLLLQSSTRQNADIFSKDFPTFVTVQPISNRVSLSKARNLLLSEDVAGSAVGSADVVAFPDDDCWYPTGTLARIVTAFASDPDLEFWFCRYGAQPVSPRMQLEMVPSLQMVIGRASSNTVFFRGPLVKEVGGFDETLGVGAQINGGEDTDYALRAFYKAKQTKFLNSPIVGHRDFDPKLKSRYFAGSLVAVCRHAGKSPAGIWAMLRKILIGITLVMRGRMPASDFITAVKISLGRRANEC